MAKKKTYEDEDEKAPPPSHDLVESDVRPQMHVPGTGTETAVQVGPQSVDMTGFDGAFLKKSEIPDDPNADQPEPYGLKIIENDPQGNTHHAKNQDHYWSGTKQQFEDQFKED